MKKIISFVITVALLCTILVSAAFAAGATVAVSSAEADKGENVTVSVSISGNTGFDTYLMALDYDAAALELVSVSAGALSAGGQLAVNGASVAFMTTTPVTGDGVLFTATFKALAEGEAAVGVVVDNVYNTVDLVAVDTAASAGKVVVSVPEEPTPEDPVCQHTETKVVDAKAATCTEEGYTGDTVCSACGEIVKKGETIHALGHNWNWIIDKEATAKETGLKHEECSVCGAKRNEGTVIPATGAGLDDVPQTSDITLTILPIVALVLAIAVFTVIANKRKAVK